MSAELIDVSVVVHLVHYCVEPLRAEMLVEEHAEYQRLLLVLNGYELELHPLHEGELILVVGPEQSLELF